MKTKPQNFLADKRLIILLIATASILLASGAYFYYRSEKDRIRKDKIDDLEAIASLKIHQITQWYKERLSEAKYFTGNEDFVDQTKNLLIPHPVESESAREYFRKRLVHIKNNHGYENIFISSTKGEIVFTLDSGFTKIDSLAKVYVQETVINKKISFKDFYYCPSHRKIHFDVMAPVIDEKGNSTAVMIFRVNPDEYLYSLIQSWPVPSRTAETLIFRKEEDHILFLNELRHRKNTALSFKIPLTRNDVVSIIAVSGKEGIIEGSDYRNVDVLADMHPVPGTKLFLAAKMDLSEVYSELESMTILLSFITVISILFIGSGITLVYKYRQGNLYKEMYLKEKELAEAQEEFRTTLYSIGDGVITTDTSGRVARMNPVAERLTGWKESAASGKYLADVFKIVKEETDALISNRIEKILRDKSFTELTGDWLLISKDGKRTPILNSGSPIRNDAKEIIGAVLIFRDETENRRKSKMLLESESRFSTVFRFSPVGIIITTLDDGKFIDVNDAFLNISGYTRQEIIGLSSVELGTWINSEERSYLLKLIREQGRAQSIETVFRNKFGEKRICSVSAAIMELKGEKYLLSLINDVTDRKYAEDNLRKQKEILQKIFDHIPVMINFVDKDGQIKMINREWENTLGWTLKEITGQNIDILAEAYPDPKSRQDALNFVAESNGKWADFKTRIRNGRVIDTSWALVRLSDETYVGIGQDITERKKAEAALRASETQLATALEIAHLGYWEYDVAKDLFTFNDQLYKLFRTTAEQEGGYTMSSSHYAKRFVHPDEMNMVGKEIKKAIETSNPFFKQELEHRIVYADGEIGTIAVQFFVVKDREGRTVKTYGVNQDITDRKLAEENIRKLSRGVEQSPAAIVITDINGCIEYVNPKFTEFTGYSIEEVRGQNSRILKSGNKTPEDYKELWETILDKKDWRGEFLNRKKNGELYWESASISPILNEHGEITNFIAVKEDITEVKKMTDELIEAKEKAEEMNRIKSYFFANMSHELRTPFVGIIGFSELLVDKLQNPEEREMAELILESSRRLTDTLNKVLNITKLEFDKIDIELCDVDIFKMIENLQTLYSRLASQQNTQLKTVFRCRPVLFKTDEKLLQEILSNLITNAIKFTSNGFIEIIIDLDIKQGTNYLIIKVSDTGMGIPKDKQEIIWNEFRQVSEGYNRSFQGTGLGLSITKKYVELLRGNIYLESEVGKGSVFTIKLPAVIEKDIQVKKEIPLTTDKTALGSVKKIISHKILYVEDDSIAADLVKRILSKYYHLEIVEEAKIALEKIKNNQYSALLVDINLGYGMDGVELMQIVRENPYYKTIPIIAVTAYASTNEKEEFLSKGFSNYISKPFLSKELINLLEKVFNE